MTTATQRRNLMTTTCTVDDEPVRSLVSDGAALAGTEVPARPERSEPVPRGSPRPEAVRGSGDTSTSGASNKGTFDQKLRATINQRKQQIAAREGVPESAVPADAVTASGSGLDPDISPAYAALQFRRVARVTGLPVARVQELVAQATDGRILGCLG